MSFIKKAMANVFGIGGTKVDTILSTTNTTPGGLIEGNVHIYGGEVEQQIQSLYIDVKTTYEKETNDKKMQLEAVVQRYTIDINRTISSNEDIKIPFSFNLSLNCPVSKHKSRVWISTRLDIENAVDNLDGDSLRVIPNKYMDNILDSVSHLGFRLREVENVYDKYRMSSNKFVQEFEYVPVGEFRGRLDELEVVLISNLDGIRVFLQVDRKVRGLGSLLSEKLSLDESLVYIDFTYDELSNTHFIIDTLRSTIKRYS